MRTYSPGALPRVGVPASRSRSFTLWREGPHWYNGFENQASEDGLFGGIVNGSVQAELMCEIAR